MSLAKKKTSEITKEELIDLYYNQKLNLDQIGKNFGFYDRQPIQRLFKKFDIKTRSKTENASINHDKKIELISKIELENLLKTNSILSISRMYNVHRSRIYMIMEHYGLKSDYFKNLVVIKKLKSYKNKDNKSPEEIALELNTNIGLVKKYVPIKQIIYSLEETKNKLLKFIENKKVDNQGFIKQLKFGDINLYKSILDHTQNHKLQSKKFTERLYRIVNDFESDKEIYCINTNQKLKFYTFDKGYGNSKLQVSKEGFVWTEVFNLGYSKISQELFWTLFDKIDKINRKYIKFQELNGELRIRIPKQIISENTNKYSYSADFIYKSKNIEFDGEYWHKHADVKVKDEHRDIIMNSLGYEVLRIKEEDYINNPEETIQKCLTFLNQ